MKFDKKTIIGEFIKRPNRFQAYVIIDGKEEMIHVPNTGRLREILLPNARCLIRVEDNPKRKTKYSLIGAYKNGFLINFDSQIPNKVVEEALLNKKIKKLKKYNIVEREKTFGTSRFDFKLSKDFKDTYYLEVKGVTLEDNGIVSFPDAPTIRGARHLRELSLAKKEGYGAGVIFLVQMEKAKYFTPFTLRDEDFTKALIEAKESGVDIMAYVCDTREDSLTLLKQIPVKL